MGWCNDYIVMERASVDGFHRELDVTENKALNLIGQSATIAKHGRELYSPRTGMAAAVNTQC